LGDGETEGGSGGRGRREGHRLLLRFYSYVFIYSLTQGTMLFTGNTAIVSVALMEKKVSRW